MAQALLQESGRRLEQAVALDPLGRGTRRRRVARDDIPIVQGPMTRVSDVAGFAQAVAEAGALPMLALALMRPEQVDALLTETTRAARRKALGRRAARLCAGRPDPRPDRGRPAARAAFRADRRRAPGPGARRSRAEGVTSYLHVPSPRLLTMFLEQGAKRFVLEGRECGGHVGPLSSFVLWDTMVSTLLATVTDPAQAQDIHILFAGGVHDALSAAMVACIAAPLAERGMKVGVLAGTRLPVHARDRRDRRNRSRLPGSGARLQTTVTLETGPGHASRAAMSPFAEDFLARRRELEGAGRSGDEMREDLEAFSLGRLRVASKAQERAGADGRLHKVPTARQKREGMFMIGQVGDAAPTRS